MGILDITFDAALMLPLARVESRPCPYLPGREESDLIALGGSVTSERYQRMMDRGFRRAGGIFYRPDCRGCRRCEPIRVPVEEFRPSRSQRRTMRKNTDVVVRVGAPVCDESHWELYERYQARYHDRTMSGSPGDYESFFCGSPIDTLEMSYWLDDRLVGVGLVDVCPASLSSVYFFYDPDESRRSLGVFSALVEIDECRRRGLPYWYIGFYVKGCRKMEYKSRFRPYELLSDGGTWRRDSDSA